MITDKYWVFENIEDAALLIDKLQQQRDELLAALKEIKRIIIQSDDGYLAQDTAEQAIAKVESEK